MAAVAAPKAVDARAAPRKWATLIAVAMATFMLFVDITIVNVAVPAVQRSLHASFAGLEWVINAYTVALAALLLNAGSLADLLGRRRVFTAGLVVFSGASLVCGLASSTVMLDVARGVQGVGGAIVYATSLSLLAHVFQGRDAGIAFGVFGAVTGAAVAVGPLLGGALTSGLGWRWIFFVNVPVGIAVIALVRTRVDESRDPDARGVDWAGLFTFGGGLLLFVLGLIRGNAEGWGSAEIVVLLAGGVALLASFVAIELAQARPMLDLSLFRRPAFVGTSVTAFALSGSLFATFLFVTLYLQDVLAYEPLAAGLRAMPLTATAFAVAPLSGWLTVRLPLRVLLSFGLALMGAGLLLMTGLSASSRWTHLLPGLFVAGAGMGVVLPALAAAALRTVEAARSGMASGINATFRQVGVAVGIAALGAVFQYQVVARAVAALPPADGAKLSAAASHGELGSRFASGGLGGVTRALPPESHARLAHALRTGFTGALDEVLAISAGLALVASLLALMLVRTQDMRPAELDAAPRRI